VLLTKRKVIIVAEHYKGICLGNLLSPWGYKHISRLTLLIENKGSIWLYS